MVERSRKRDKGRERREHEAKKSQQFSESIYETGEGAFEKAGRVRVLEAMNVQWTTCQETSNLSAFQK